MNIDQLKQAVCKQIDENAEKIIAIGRDIYLHPELGFKENRTAELVASTLKEMGLVPEENLAITGVKAVAKGKQSKSTVMIMGELDAVICQLHPDADKATGASHSCGHHAQVTCMLAAAMGLTPFMKELDGNVAFVAVPAEEYVELEFRKDLQKQGKIEFMGGKQEFIRLGVFDDVDMGLMLHSHAGITERKFLPSCCSTGFVGKLIKFIGKEAHSGAAPELGINALNAASLSMMAINSLRETFKDSDGIRVHPIITKGGDLVNIVPADVRMETYVRGRTIDAVVSASEKVNRALKGSAYAIGAEVEIQEMPGYLPLIQNEAINELFAENAVILEGEDSVLYGYELMGSSDAGDLSSVMPFAHLSGGGFGGAAHSRDFTVEDEEMAYIQPAKAMAMTAIDLLWDNAQKALEIKETNKPYFATKEDYLVFWRKFNQTL